MRIELVEGIITKRDDPKNKGRYYVFVPELQYNDLTDNPPVDGKYSGYWCYNNINNFSRYTETEFRDFKDTNSYGSYQPLKPGTHVSVGLPVDSDGNISNSIGFILNIISFDSPPNSDRDDFYLLQTTDKESWMYFDEKNKNFALSLHGQNSNVWGNDKTIHLSKKSGTVVEVHDDHILNFHSSGNFCYIDGNEITASIGGTFIKMSKDRMSLKSKEIYIQGENLVAIEGNQIEIADGVPVPDQVSPKSNIAKTSLDPIKAVNEADKKAHTKLKNGQPQ